jgi:phosphoribosyl-ATP pyrophosphohydrolase
MDQLQSLYSVILDRKQNPVDGSYTTSLIHTKGLNEILKKIGEESIELILAGKNGVKEEIIYETADLIYHMAVLLVYYDIPLDKVYEELERRRKP